MRGSFPHGWRPWRPFASASKPSATVSASGPWELLRADRRVALTTGALRMVAMDRFLVAKAGLLLAAPLAQAQWSGGAGWSLAGPTEGRVVLLVCVLAYVLQGVSLTAWGRYTLARLWLAAGRRLPWRTAAFLRDAHARGVLRQSGGHYQFRHLELRNRLAGEVPLASRTDWIERGQASRRRAVLAHAAVGLALVFWTGNMGSAIDGQGPFRSTAPVCSLLRSQDLVPAMKNPSRQNFYGVSSCLWTEQGPGRPSGVRLTILTVRPGISRSARRSADAYVGSYGADRVEVPGLADRASVRAASVHVDPANPVTEPGAEVTARLGNVVVVVAFAEKYAADARERAVAVVLVERVLNNAGIGPPPKGSLTQFPRRSPADSPEGRHLALVARPVKGAVWAGVERSQIVALNGVPFVFRGPRSRCTSAEGEAYHLCHYASGMLMVYVFPCARSGCTDQDTLRVFRTEFWFPVEEEAWKRHDAGTLYSEMPSSADGDGGTYGEQLLRRFSVGDHQYLMAVRMSMDRANAAVVHKTVNDIVTQAGFPLAGP